MTDHAPDTPFGCSFDWGDRIGIVPGRSDARLHICNLDSHHDGDHACKCGEMRRPVPGPPGLPKCRECRTTPDLRRGTTHTPECSIGQEQQVHFGNVRAVEDALRAEIDKRRQDRPFMERLAARVRADANILEALASGDREA